MHQSTRFPHAQASAGSSRMTGRSFRAILGDRYAKGDHPMKAIRVSEYGGPSVLKIEDVPIPAVGPNQVLVRNHAVGVNPVDTYLRSNTDNRGPKLPYTPGSDAAGVVEAVGPGVTAVKTGDRVYVGGTVSGAYAELSLCDAAQVHSLPEKAT